MNKKLLTKREIETSVKLLREKYPDPPCGLIYTSAFELTLSLILAAQCRDEVVNVIRPKLTEKYPTPEAIRNAGINEVFKIIKSCSFPNNKARHIVNACTVIINKYNGNIPNTMEELTQIPGIGRKSANIILAEGFGIIEGIAVDTHVTRISQKIGYTAHTTPLEIEKDLMKKIPKKYWDNINHTLVHMGKTICTARKQDCSNCILNGLCKASKAVG